MTGRRMLCGAFGALLVAGCSCGGGPAGDDAGTAECVGLRPGEICGQGSSFPLGSIVGRVTAMADGAGLKGVTVSVASRPAVTTDDNGYYELKDLPAGATYRVRFALQDFVTMFADGTLPDSTGNYPQGNAVAEVNAILSAANAGLTGKVFLPGGQPAEGVVLAVDLRGAGFEWVRSATTDATGTFSLTGLPGAPTGVEIAIVVQPFDQDKDGRADYGVWVVKALAFPGVTSRVDVDLRLAANALLLLSSNLDDGTHKLGDPLVLVFNRALVSDSVQVSLTDTDLARAIAATFALDTARTTLTITPSGGALILGNNYRLNVSARADNATTGAFTKNFREMATGPVLGKVSGLTIRPTNIDFNTTSLTAAWSPVTGAASYRIFARDTAKNTAYQQIGTAAASTTPGAGVLLPASFDWLAGDGLQTPFVNATAVDIAVVPVDVVGNSIDPAAATPVRLTDNISPHVMGVVQSGSADNSAGTSAATLSLYVQFNEYMNVTIAPTLALPTGLTSTWAPDTSLYSGTLTITVPAGVNGVGAFSISGAVDSSGNLMTSYDGNLRAQTQLLADPGFEAGVLTAWSPSTTGTASAPALVTSPVFKGTYAVRLGNASGGTTIQSGQSQITQLMTVPAGSTAVTVMARYQTFTNFPSPGHDSSACVVYTGAGMLVGTVFNDYQSYPSFQAASATFNVTAGTQIRLTCYSFQDGSHVSGLYLDDLQVLAN